MYLLTLLMELKLDWLLSAAWIAGTLPILIASIPSSYLNSYRQVLLGFARRGKIMQSPSRFTVPQKFFLHFYLVAVVWTFLLLVMIWYYAFRLAPMGPDSLDLSTATSHLTGGSHVFSLHKSHIPTIDHRYRVWRSVFLLLLMEIHVLRRLFETVYVFKYSSSARMHIFGYLTGMYFYVATPLSLCHFYALKALYFVADQAVELNAKGQRTLPLTDFNWQGYVKPMTKLGWWQWTGAALFTWGWVHQHRCHVILGSLRKHRRQDDEYVIPHGDWFEVVSSPHYLAEIVIYAGLLVASEGTDTTIWLLLLFVVANLSLAAAETQRWYHRKFEGYPRNRWAIVPFVY